MKEGSCHTLEKMELDDGLYIVMPKKVRGGVDIFRWSIVEFFISPGELKDIHEKNWNDNPSSAQWPVRCL